jgi:hypothetical protein
MRSLGLIPSRQGEPVRRDLLFALAPREVMRGPHPKPQASAAAEHLMAISGFTALPPLLTL